MSLDRALISLILTHLTDLQSTFLAEQKESLEAACQCITSATGVEVDHSNHESLSSIYGVYQAINQSITADSKFNDFVQLLESKDFFKGCEKGSKQYNDRLGAAKKKWIEKQSTSQTSAPKAVSEADKASAERFKGEGNSYLSSGQYDLAIEKYSQAIKLNPHNAVYWANRAAALINQSNYQSALNDCKQAIQIDETYAKAHYRLGQCYLNLYQYSDAIPAYERALELTASDPSMHSTISEQLEVARSKLAGEDNSVVADEDGGDEGAFDMASLLNNPMLSQMAESLGAGNMDFGALMSNPMVQQMAQNMFANMGGRMPTPPAAAASSAPSQTPDLNSFLQSDAAASLVNDPDFGPVVEDIRKNGQSAVFKHMSNPKFMAKIQQLMQKPSK